MKPRLARCVAGREVTLIRRVFEGAPADSINLGMGQPTDPIPEPVRAAAAAIIDSRQIPYSPTAGLAELRRSVARRLFDDASADQVVITAGSQQALWLALMGLVDPGDEVIVPEPGYPAYPVVTEMIGARPVPLVLDASDGFRIDVDRVRSAWSERTRAVIVASPANPTGMAAAADDAPLAELHALCAERDAWLIADEIYRPLRYRELHAPLHRFGERVIAIGGISKAFSATGFRVGWLQADASVVTGLVPLHQQVALCAPTVGQHAALACMQLDTGYFDELRARYGERRSAALAALAELDGLAYTEPDGAFYVFVDVRHFTDDTYGLAMRIRDEARVITAPGEAFGASGRGFLRLSFATEPARIREGIGRLGEVLRRVA